MKTACIAVILVLLAGNVLADPQPWMVNENPNELGVHLVGDSGCPRTHEDEYQNLIADVLVRSRIKRASNYLRSDEVDLAVDIQCIDYVDVTPGF